MIRDELERYAKDLEFAYKERVTPPLAKVDLYWQSGHLPYYQDAMFPVMEVEDQAEDIQEGEGGSGGGRREGAPCFVP